MNSHGFAVRVIASVPVLWLWAQATFVWAIDLAISNPNRYDAASVLAGYAILVILTFIAMVISMSWIWSLD